MPSGIRTRTSGIMVPAFVAPTSTEDAATTAWVNAVVAAGGTVSATQRTRVNTLIVGLRADGLLAILDRLWLFGGESVSQQATIDIINLGVGTTQGTIPLTAAGFTGNNADGVFKTDFTPSSGTPHFTTNSATIGFYAQASGTADGQCQIGATPTVSCRINLFQVESVFRARINTNTFFDYTISTDKQGLFIATRTGANAQEGFKNGSSVGTDTTASDGTVPTDFFSVMARHDGGASYADFDDSQISCAFIGGGMTATQMTNISSRINTYMTAWSINVY